MARDARTAEAIFRHNAETRRAWGGSQDTRTTIDQADECAKKAASLERAARALAVLTSENLAALGAYTGMVDEVRTARIGAALLEALR
jgi:hypothetical protein